MADPEAATNEAAAPTPSSDYVSDRTFADFPIAPSTLQGLNAMGYTSATPVQAAVIDPAIAGLDLIVRAKTGTGKTCAFGVPLIERVTEGAHQTQALVLTPTRELAVQVAQEVANIAKFRDVRIAAIYGGVGFGPQEDALRDGAEIVVGTPGRIIDHLRRGNLRLENLRVAVLDEADEMLSMGFLEDVKRILDKASKERQTLLFSATLDESLRGFARTHMKSPEDIHLSHDGDNVELITHVLYETSPDYHKARALLDLIEQERPQSAIIFCNTREDVATVHSYLDRQGLGVEMLSGDLQQKQRERVMARIKSSAVQFLVSTDVAARGIDISDLSHVIMYSLPEDPAVYLHRSGRTGRIGKTGTCICLADGPGFSTRQVLEKQHKIAFAVKALPTADESARLRTERFARLLKEASGTMAFESYRDTVRALRERPDADTLLAVALRAFLEWDRRRKFAEADRQVEGEPQADRSDENREGRRDDRADRRPDRRDERRGDRPGDRPEARRDGGRDGGREGGRDERREPRRDERRDERPHGRDRDRNRGERRDARPQGDATAAAVVAPPAPRPAATDDAAPRQAKSAGEDVEEDEGDEVTAGGEGANSSAPGTEGADDAAGQARKRRRRRRRRSTGPGAGGPGSSAAGDGSSGDGGAAPAGA